MRIIIRSSHMRAIDFHVHLPTPEWLDVTMAGYTEAAERYFRSPGSRRTLAEVAAEYEALDILAVLLAWVAAEFPDFQIVAAHFGFPWHDEMLAIALHKTNVHIDISGWAPRYIPATVVRELKGRLQDRFLFGSDYPFIQPQRCLDELGQLEIPDPVLEKLLVGNGTRLLGL